MTIKMVVEYADADWSDPSSNESAQWLLRRVREAVKIGRIRELS